MYFITAMDASVLGRDVHNINVLTVIANESYDSFAKQLQSEIAEVVADRPIKVSEELFVYKTILDANGRNELTIDEDLALQITHNLTINGYLDHKKELTDKYYDHVRSGYFEIADEVADYKTAIVGILDKVYNPDVLKPEDARAGNIELQIDEERFRQKEFKNLWNRISNKSAYVVNFDNEELIKKSIRALNNELRVVQILVTLEHGEMKKIESREALKKGESFSKAERSPERIQSAINTSVKYDLVGKIAEDTGLTRRDIVEILKGIEKSVFNQFHRNPEDFIIKAANLINEEKATVIIEHITYNKLEESYSSDLFTEPTLKGRLGVNAMKTERHLYDHLLYDSNGEKEFAEKLDGTNDVAVYVKLPRGFYINTPVGKYNPDWAIAFEEGKVKHIYFVAETKGDLSTMELRKVEELKMKCAKEHFKAISNDSVRYKVVDNYDTLLNEVMR